MIETSYHSLPIEPPNTYKHVVCIIGGAGISTVLPILRTRASANSGRSVPYWGCRSPALVREVGVDRLSGAGVQVHVRVGERWEVSDLVARETRGSRGNAAIIVSGPPGMADDVRYAVVQANKARRRKGREGVVRLIEECFRW
jgi:NAD(P)H-flavin reductase